MDQKRRKEDAAITWNKFMIWGFAVMLIIVSGVVGRYTLTSDVQAASEKNAVQDTRISHNAARTEEVRSELKEDINYLRDKIDDIHDAVVK